MYLFPCSQHPAVTVTLTVMGDRVRVNLSTGPPRAPMYVPVMSRVDLRQVTYDELMLGAQASARHLECHPLCNLLTVQPEHKYQLACMDRRRGSYEKMDGSHRPMAKHRLGVLDGFSDEVLILIDKYVSCDEAVAVKSEVIGAAWKGMGVTKVPTMGGKPLDLRQLYCAVRSCSPPPPWLPTLTFLAASFHHPDGSPRRRTPLGRRFPAQARLPHRQGVAWEGRGAF